MDTRETYFVDFGQSRIYYRVYDENTVITPNGEKTISRQKFLDYLATARELGHKTGKI